MKQFRLFACLAAFSLLILSSCQKEMKTESPANAPVLQSISKNKAAVSPARLDALKASYAKLQALLPTGQRNGLKAKTNMVSRVNPEYRNMVLRALAVEPTPCNSNTAINLWLDQQLADWNATIINYVLDLDLLNVPTYYALVFENSSANQQYGEDGEYTHPITKTFKDLKRFWNIQTSNIVLAAMHGSTLRDRDKVIKTYEAAYGLDSKTATFLADFIQRLLDVFPQLRNGEHPIFTFNAYAQSGFNFPPYGTIPPKIVMGDGILEAYDALGYEDVAPQAVLAHEFGHHIQFQLNLFTNVGTPEGTRRTELMADAFSAYYLSHARGAAMQWKRVKQFLQVFFNIGDCAFENPNHHGTPTQRMAAAEWGYQVADNAQKQGHILTAQKFSAMFDAKLPWLIKQ